MANKTTPNTASRQESGNKQKSLLSFFGNKKATENASRTPEQPRGKDATKRQNQLTTPTAEISVESDKGRRSSKQVDDFHVSSESLPTPVTPLDSQEEEEQTITVDTTTVNNTSSQEDDRSIGYSSPIKKSRNRNVSYEEQDSSDDDDVIISAGKSKQKSKRKRPLADLSDSEDEFVAPDDKGQEAEDEDMHDFVVSDDEDDDYSKPKRPSPKRSRSSQTRKASSSLDKSSSNILSSPSGLTSSPVDGDWKLKYTAGSSYRAASSTNASPKPPPRVSSSPFTSGSKHKAFEQANEERYAWTLEPRDAQGHTVDHVDYDSRTLYIPKSAWAKFTPFERQYWEVKSKMWDTVVFFKKGKFYELYEKDADVAHSLFDLKLAGGGRANMRLCGVPEMSFDYWAASFISKGYKVAKVEQKESALAKEMRDAKAGGKKEEKVVKRELSCVLTSGTLVDGAMLVDDMSTFCLAIKEKVHEDGHFTFGICFVDTATGEFNLTEFDDDTDYAKFETLVAQLRPRELILEKGQISSRTVRVLKNNTSLDTLWNYLIPEREFWTDDIAIEELARGEYFDADDLDDTSQWPDELKKLRANHSSGDNNAATSALGALLWYLRSLKIDKELVSLGNFSAYDPIRKSNSLVLDGQSLQNLEIFANTFDGGDQGTVFKLVNKCISPFGKRLLRNWLCHPLMDANKINARLDAVDRFNTDYEFAHTLEQCLVGLSDLERLLSRIHAGKLGVKDFVRVLEGFESIYELVVKWRTQFDIDESSLLCGLLNEIPDLAQVLQVWSEAFDRDKAKNDGILIPESGFDADFDRSHKKIQEIERELVELLRQYRRDFKSQELAYKDSGKEIYLIELSIKTASKVPPSWQQMGATSKVKRYYSPEVRNLVRQLLEARETHKVITDDIQSRMYDKFDQHYKEWLKAVKVIGSFDCLLSLAKTSASLGTPSCRPEFVPDSQDNVQGFVDFKSLRHPCFSSTMRGTDFIPNDVSLGSKDHGNITLLTGANAAGKSTVLRMTCVAVILAQMGCYVPAEEARLVPIDRIMTRLGANDNIFAGQSTFFVELAETKRMLSEATERSLLVIDELGRGGSSSDGFAIAEAVLHHIATHMGCIGFFATHYASLAQSFDFHPQVEPKRMAVLFDDDKHNVTFLYKLEPGVSPGSFGMHVAAMCGVFESIIKSAEQAAENYEHTSRMRKLMAFTKSGNMLSLGIQSDFKWMTIDGAPKIHEACLDPPAKGKMTHAMQTILEAIDNL